MNVGEGTEDKGYSQPFREDSGPQRDMLNGSGSENEYCATHTIRVGEMFAGIGGFRLGLERAGHKVVWANELDKYACQIYRKNFGSKELVEGDIHKINTDSIPPIDLLVGGFPCQPHSLAGKRQGFKEVRGTVFHEIIRVAKAKRPRLLLLENVKGLLSSEQGRAFGVVLEELGNIGYWCEWQTLNSKYFGVPQNRERVFIIGHLRGSGGKQIFPIRQSSEVFGEKLESKDVCPTITSRYYKREKTDPYIIDGHHHQLTEEKGTLTGRENRQGTNWCISILRDNLGGNIKDRVRENGDAWTLGGSETLVAQALQTDGYLRSGSSFGTNKPQSARNIRRLTPTECERLQGFPDGWTECVSDTQRYKTLGNAVTVNVIEFLGRLLVPAKEASK